MNLEILHVTANVITGLICLIFLLYSLRFFRHISDGVAYKNLRQGIRDGDDVEKLIVLITACDVYNRQVLYKIQLFKGLFTLTVVNFFIISVLASNWFAIVMATLWPLAMMGCLWLLRTKAVDPK